MSGLPQEKNRTSGKNRTPMQAACRCQIKACRVAADFDNYRAKIVKPCCLFRDPERICKPRTRRHEKPVKTSVKLRHQPRRVGKAGFMKGLPVTDPENRAAMPGFKGGAQGERQRKSGCRSPIAGLKRNDLRQRRTRDTAAKRGVEGLAAGRKTLRQPNPHAGGQGFTVLAQNGSIPHASLGRICLRRPLQPLQLDAFNFRDFPAQGVNDILRHGACCHDSLT